MYSIAFVLFLLTQANAQQVEFYRTELGHYGIPEKYKNVSGSPYLFENWMLGTVKTIDNAKKKRCSTKI